MFFCGFGSPKNMPGGFMPGTYALDICLGHMPCRFGRKELYTKEKNFTPKKVNK
jgi:hypothetical protein